MTELTPEAREAGRRALEAFGKTLADHEPCRWEQVGPCVYCKDHGLRLYQGQIPDERRTIPKCADGEHEWDNADSMSQGGFYFLCLRCGVQEWTE